MQAVTTRLRAVMCIAILFLGPEADAQERPPREPSPAGAVNVFNLVEGRTTVLSCKAEGTRVKEGELICELDSSSLKDRLAVEGLRIRSAQADLDGAKLAREAAEIALVEYTEGTFKHEMQTYLGEKSLTEAARKRAEDQLEWSNRMLNSGYVSLGRNVADKISLRRATFADEASRTKFEVFVKHTKSRALKQLQAELAKAKAQELDKQADHDQHRANRTSLARRIEHCRVLAPTAGRLHFTRPMGAGAVVLDGEVLLQIVPEKALQSSK